ncbi:MAG: outer membrane protein [Parasphingorhabdus sp.]|jgi:outer membrane protein
MLKRILLTLSLVFAMATVSAEELKIGFVDAVKLIEEAPQGERSLADLEKEFSPRDREIRQLRDQLRKEEADLEKNSLVMKQSDAQRLQESIKTKRRTLKRTQAEFKEDYNLRRNAELQKLQEIVTEAIIEIAESEGYDLIVQQAVFANKTINITEKVLKKLGK